MRPSGIRIALGSLALTAAAGTALITTQVAQASPEGNWSRPAQPARISAVETTSYGCPSANACMYTNTGWNNSSPEHLYYQYGCYNITGESGDRFIYNNQSSGAPVTLWSGTSCTGESLVTLTYQSLWSGEIATIHSLSVNRPPG
jgi:hypothetical protein